MVSEAQSSMRRGKGSLLGIFWFIRGRLLVDTTPLSEAELYGDFLTHPRGHAAVWEQRQQNGTLPEEMEYEEQPRGRVMFNTKTFKFTLLADRCILKRKAWVAQVKKELRLPRDTNVGGDTHYRCFDCLSRSE